MKAADRCCPMNMPSNKLVRAVRDRLATTLGQLHRSEEGAISLLTVFSVLILTMLLGMVMNVGRHADHKIRMQNAADSAAYSGAAVIARGMNTLAFTNNLLFDVFALDAWMREARDRNAERYTPEILEAWRREGAKFRGSGFEKFERLADAIDQPEGKVALETDVIRAFLDWGTAAAEPILPMLEYILRGDYWPQGDGLIGEFQREVMRVYPDIAQTAALEAARRTGSLDRGRRELVGVLWRCSYPMQPVAGGGGPWDRVLPVIDPANDLVAGYQAIAARQRNRRVQDYLDRRNATYLAAFTGPVNFAGTFGPSWGYRARGKMSQFGPLWEGFTCGQKERLLDEHLTRNLPFLIRTRGQSLLATENPAIINEHLNDHFTFIGVVYRSKARDFSPGLFRFHRFFAGDEMAFAQARVFIPQPRLWRWSGGGRAEEGIGGMPGDVPSMPGGDEEEDDGEEGDTGGSGPHYVLHGHPAWDLFNQSWCAQLVPATHAILPDILREPVPTAISGTVGSPAALDLDSADLRRISAH